MITQPNDFLMRAWRQQVDGCLCITAQQLCKLPVIPAQSKPEARTAA